MARKPEAPPKYEYLSPSKTTVKNEMHALQDLATELLEIPLEQLAALEMSDTLRDAFAELRRMTNFGARRRQAQYVGKLLRQADDVPLRRAITAFRLGQTRAAQHSKSIEVWRDRIIASDDALTEWLQVHPYPELPALRTLIRLARQEVAAATTPDGEVSGVKGKAYRDLFQRLRSAMSPPG